jgi:hypothetical protein
VPKAASNQPNTSLFRIYYFLTLLSCFAQHCCFEEKIFWVNLTRQGSTTCNTSESEAMRTRDLSTSGSHSSSEKYDTIANSAEWDPQWAPLVAVSSIRPSSSSAGRKPTRKTKDGHSWTRTQHPLCPMRTAQPSRTQQPRRLSRAAEPTGPQVSELSSLLPMQTHVLCRSEYTSMRPDSGDGPNDPPVTVQGCFVR